MRYAIRSRTCAALTLAAVAAIACGAAAARNAGERAIYLVALADPPLVAHAAERVAPGLAAPDHRRALRLELDSADSEAYLRYLDAQRARVLDRASRQIGRTLTPRQVYRQVNDGMALALDAGEAASVAALPGVVAVRRERVLHLATDAGPEWIGADQLWSGAVGGLPATRGEGVVIGVIDTGINPAHPSFAAAGADGDTIVNPRGHFYGLCASGQAQCNAKLIGIYDFTSEGTQGIDSVGHGSHVSGIAAGDAISDALHGYTVSLARNVSGVAPHANLIMYKGCNAKPIDSKSDGTCAESALVAAINQATADRVDVINYSIGGDAYDPYELLADPTTDVAAFFHAREAGIVVAASAGNSGPDAGTVDEPGNAPWVIAAANASHDRRFANSIGSFSGAPNAPPTLAGQGYTSGYGPAQIVYAGNYGNALCGTGATEGITPTGASNPFAAGTFHGEIVICDRGIYARVEKGYNVKAAGAGGYILANAPSDGESIISDNHFLPAVHLGYSEGQALEAWVATAGTHDGTIAGVSAVLDPDFGDVLDASSSRGPYGFSGGILKPDITAPGDNILSAAQTGSGLALLSGTSMASPHVAGSAALLIALHPDWVPAQVESALLGTALANSVRLQDGSTLASPLDAGSGRVQPARAANAGLYLPLNGADFFGGSGSISNPLAHGDLAGVNRVGIESESCSGHCGFTRTVTDMSNGGTWQVSATATTGARLDVTPSQFTLAAHASQTLHIALDVTDPRLPGSWVDGRILLHKTAGPAAADIALTVAAYASSGTAPAFRVIAAPEPVGNADFQISGLAALPQASFTATSLVPATTTNLTLGVDPQPVNLYDNFPGSGKQFVLFPNVYQHGVDTAAYGRLFIVEIAASNAPLADLYAGIDSNGDGLPNQAEQACRATATSGSTAAARCVVDLSGAGQVNVWALVDVPSGTAGVNYSVTLGSGIPSVNTRAPSGLVAQQLHVAGPGHVDAGAAFPLRVFWGPDGADDATPLLGQGTYYGGIMIDGTRGLDAASLGQSGVVPLSLTRGAGDDIADALHSGVERTLYYAAGESLRHTFIDAPPGTAAILVDSRLASGSGPLSFSLVRADFPQSSASPQIAAAPVSGGALSWTLNAVATEQNLTLSIVSPGRWYIASQNGGGDAAAVVLSVRLQPGTAPVPALAPGNYFNPQRSGHGIFVSQAAGQQVVDWYTYLADGTPAWYVAQGAAPPATAGSWSSTLYRVTWDGATGTPTPVGDAVLTMTAADQAIFSWHLFGESGSEAFMLLAPPDCVSAGGSVNLSGEWYAPAQSGYGFDALVLPGQQFDAFYMYDGLGNPRWVVGANGPFAASSTIAMLQSTGFCPVCAYQALTTQTAGSMTIAYANGSGGQLTTAIALNPPLSGTWNISQPIARLTGTAQCPQ